MLRREGVKPYLISIDQNSAFKSNTEKGLLHFTVPALEEVWKEYEPATDGVWTFYVSVIGHDGMEVSCS